MMRADQLLELLERDALPRLDVPAAGDLLKLQHLRTKLVRGRPLSRDDRIELVYLIDDRMLPIGAGRPEGPGDPRQRFLQLAVCLRRIGRQVYLAVYTPCQRDWKSARKPVARRALELTKLHQQGVEITVDELLDYTEGTRAWARDYVAEHIPDARQLMRVELPPPSRR